MPNAGTSEAGESRAEPEGPPSGKNICVYLGGNLGREQRYIAEANALGRLMAAESIGLVYGGARVGLMGVLASAVLDHGGFVTGVVPKQLSYQELAHEGLSRLIEVATMHERKHLMQRLSQGCIALPGGFGTLEEIVEALCWSQKPLELHEKPCCFANIDGYYDHLFAFLDHATARGLLLPQNRALARQAPSAPDALRTIQAAWDEEEQAMLEAIKAYRS
ncbi:MAG: TIGR00730 family Rossman fold protein [Gemmatimonadota bacterium]|nr:TIGR00730 family Rossman fold protein [Gemmatimonadota bacterium]